MSAKKPRRRMEFEEMTAARQLGACRFSPGTAAKRFARQISAVANSEMMITDGQGHYLLKLIVQFRRQLPVKTVAWAQGRIELFAQAAKDMAADMRGEIEG